MAFSRNAAAAALFGLVFTAFTSLASAQTATPDGFRTVQVDGTTALADAQGDTLYISDRDSSGSACTGACAQTWPPFAASPEAQARGLFTILTRADGTKQWVYQRKPLYRFSGDGTPGEANGNGIDGIWHIAAVGGLETIAVTSVNANAYRARTTATGTKTDAPIMQTPLNVQVVTHQVLQDQQVIGIDQALKNVSGVTVGAGGGADNGQGFSSIFIRGFSSDAHFRDGVRIDSFGGDSNTFATQFANVESVSVLKGPAAVLYGAVEPGGIVNIVTKQPLATPFFSFEQQFGSYGLVRSAIDETGPLSASGKLLYRLNASYENADSFTNYVYTNDVFVAPVARYSPGSSDQFTLEYEYHHANFGQNYGFMPLGANGLPLNSEIGVNYGNYSPEIEVTNLAGLTWDHTFSTGWKLKTQVLSNATNTDGAGLIPEAIATPDPSTPGCSTPSGYCVGRGQNNVHNDDFSWTVSSDLSKQFGSTGGTTQMLLVGTDFVHFQDFGGINQAGEIDSNVSYVDLLNPINPGSPFTGPTTPFITDTTTNSSLGIYAQDQMFFPGHVVLLGGLRYQGFHQTSAVAVAGPLTVSPPLDDAAITPRVGVLWQPHPSLSLYVNGAGNFGPNNAGYTQANGQPPPPTRASQLEIGAKGSLLDDRLIGTLDYFTLTKTNIPTPDLANPAFVVVTGAEQSNGWELDLQGAVSRKWQIVANFSNIGAFVTQSNNTTNPVGSPVGEVPRYTSRLWATHDFAQPGNGFNAGVGVQFNGTEPYLYAGNSGLVLPAYTLVDLMASDTFKAGGSKIQLQLNASNVFNHKYFADAQDVPFGAVAPYSAITALRGSPFTITGAIRIQPR